MRELIGRECRCVFNLPFNDWPIPGYPAWLDVVDVDMPMICISSRGCGQRLWVSASIIQTIEDTDRRPKPSSWQRLKSLLGKSVV